MVKELLNLLYSLLEAELKSSKLEKIPSDIYRSVAVQIKSLRANEAESEDNILDMLRSRERRLLHRLASRFLEVRVKKICENSGEELNGANILVEERYLSEPYSLAYRRFKRVERALWNGQESVLESVAKAVSSRYMLVRFLQPTPTFIGMDLKKYGPFEAEDVTVIPDANARALLKRGVVSEIWIEDL